MWKHRWLLFTHETPTQSFHLILLGNCMENKTSQTCLTLTSSSFSFIHPFSKLFIGSPGCGSLFQRVATVGGCPGKMASNKLFNIPILLSSVIERNLRMKKYNSKIHFWLAKKECSSNRNADVLKFQSIMFCSDIFFFRHKFVIFSVRWCETWYY